MRGGRIFIIIGIVLFIVVAIVALIYLSGVFRPAPEPTPDLAEVTPTEEPSNMIEIVVAAQNIPRGTRITEENNAVTVAEWPEESVPPGTVTDLGAVYGRITRTDIVLGMPVLEGMLTDKIGELAEIGSDAALQIPSGRVGYAMAVAGNASVAWAIRPGDHVDVLLSVVLVDIDEEYQSLEPDQKVMCVMGVDELGGLVMECAEVPIGRTEFLPNGAVMIEGPRFEQLPRTVTQMTVQDAVVLHVGTWPEEAEMAMPQPTPTPAPTPEGEEADQTAPPPTPQPPQPLVEWVTLAVTPQDALVLKYAEETGASIDFVLRPAGETGTFSTNAVTLQYIFDRYAIEVPPKLPYGALPPIITLRPGAAGEVVSEKGEEIEYSRWHEVSGEEATTPEE